MADIDPGVCEQVFHLELEDLIVDVDVAMNLCLPNQISHSLDISAVSGHRHLLSISEGPAQVRGIFDHGERALRGLLPHNPLGWVRNSSRISIGGSAESGTRLRPRPPRR